GKGLQGGDCGKTKAGRLGAGEQLQEQGHASRLVELPQDFDQADPVGERRLGVGYQPQGPIIGMGIADPESKTDQGKIGFLLSPQIIEVLNQGSRDTSQEPAGQGLLHALDYQVSIRCGWSLSQESSATKQVGFRAGGHVSAAQALNDVRADERILP